MYLTYFDESGDTGILKSPTAWFVLNALLVHDSHWMTAQDGLTLFRNHLRTEYGIAASRELKAVHFRKGEGALAGIPRATRFHIYREMLRLEAKFQLRTFSVAIHKKGADQRGYDARELAWQFAIERLQLFCQRRNDYTVLFPDEGHGYFIRRLVRQMRRRHMVPGRFRGSTSEFAVDRILEDPNDRQSHDSHFIQLADLNAYAAHRHPAIDPNSRVPSDLWDQLATAEGDARVHEVTRGSLGLIGIKRFP